MDLLFKKIIATINCFLAQLYMRSLYDRSDMLPLPFIVVVTLNQYKDLAFLLI